MGLAGAGSASAHGSDGDGDLPKGKKLRAISYIDPTPGCPRQTRACATTPRVRARTGTTGPGSHTRSCRARSGLPWAARGRIDVGDCSKLLALGQVAVAVATCLLYTSPSPRD